MKVLGSSGAVLIEDTWSVWTVSLTENVHMTLGCGGLKLPIFIIFKKCFVNITFAYLEIDP